MSRFTLPAILTAVALAAGCAGTVHSDGGYVGGAVYTPNLVTVSPGVSVIADYHEPVFYSDNAYWRYDNYGRWHRSSYYDRGWVYAAPPHAVLSINQPHAYRNYRPQGYTVRRGVDRGSYYDGRRDRRHNDRPVVRDHRRRH